jgi:hypothetical protein
MLQTMRSFAFALFCFAACGLAEAQAPASQTQQSAKSAATSQDKRTPGVIVKKAPAPLEALIADSPELTRSLDENCAAVLAQPFCQRELGLSAEMKTAIMGAFAEASKQQTALAQKGGSDAELERIRAAADQKALSALSQTQLARLRQLSLQAFGFEALGLPELQKQLGLSPDQVTGLQGVLKEWSAAQDGFGEVLAAHADKPDSADVKAAKGKLAEAKTALSSKAFTLLTPAQASAYDAMLGTKVKVVEAE